MKLSHTTGKYKLVIGGFGQFCFPALAMIPAFLNDLRNTTDENAQPIGEAVNASVDGESLKILRAGTYFGICFADDPRNAKEILVALMEELRPFATSESGIPLKPYQMPRLVWQALNGCASFGYNVWPGFSATQRSDSHTLRNGRTGSLWDVITDEFYAQYSYGHNGPSYNGRDTNSRHEVHVAYALARNDDVPDAVVAEYLSCPRLMRDKILAMLLSHPCTRGRLSYDKMLLLQNALCARNNATVTLTPETFGNLASLVDRLPEENYFLAMHNQLYRNGLLPLKRSEPVTPIDKTPPLNDFASIYSQYIVELRIKDREKKLAKEIADGGMTDREIDQERWDIENELPRLKDMGRCNRLAKLIIDGHKDGLLSYLDNDHVKAAHKAIKEVYGIKLSGVKAADRRRGIIALADLALSQSAKAVEAVA